MEMGVRALVVLTCRWVVLMWVPTEDFSRLVNSELTHSLSSNFSSNPEPKLVSWSWRWVHSAFWGFDRRCVGTDSVPSSFSFLTLISSLSAGFFDEFTGGRGEMSDAELLAFLNQPLDSWGDIDSFFCNGNETLGMSILLHLLIQIYQWWKLPWIKESKMVPWEETLAKGGLPSPCLPSSPSLPFDLWMLLFLLSCPSPRLSRKTDLLPSLSGFGLAI